MNKDRKLSWINPEIYNQLSSTVSLTFLLYSFLDSVKSRAASALAGEFGFGSCKSDWMDVRIAATSYVGDLDEISDKSG